MNEIWTLDRKCIPRIVSLCLRFKRTRSLLLWFIASALVTIGPVRYAVAQEIPLSDLSAFQDPPENWEIVGEVVVDPRVKRSYTVLSGSGILVGAASSSVGAAELKTKSTFGDHVLEFDVLLSHGAAAEVLLQGCYGFRVADSWGAHKLGHLDNGALVAPAVEGVAALGYGPNTNAARAPGVWQHVRVVFDAPRFDVQGSKTREARILLVEQNEVLVQENQYLPAPSKGATCANETTEGPLVLRVSRGQVAIRNIKTIKYSGRLVGLEKLTYKLYVDTFLDDDFVYFGGDGGDRVLLPDVSVLEPTQAGEVERIDTRMVRGLGNNFALAFEGRIRVPVSGTYRFEAAANSIGSVEIDGDELTRWDVLHGKGSTAGDVSLREGDYPIRLLYVNFGQPRAGLFVEGPGIRRQPLHMDSAVPEWTSPEPILLTPADGPLIQRSFIYFEGEKLLTCMNVGSPDGVHYTMNLATGGLVQAWRGAFGDVTPMWHNRGDHQVLQPLGSLLSFSADQQVVLGDEESSGDVYRRSGYNLDEKGRPVFEYSVGSIVVQDHVRPGDENPILKRFLQFRNRDEAVRTVWYRVAAAPVIEQIAADLYGIGDKTYFVAFGDGVKPVIKQNGERQELLVSLQVGSKPQELTYSLIW